MVELKTEYPFIRDDGTADNGLIKHWAEDEKGIRYIIRQIETGVEYGDAVDIFPCPYTYEVTDKLEQTEDNNIEND